MAFGCDASLNMSGEKSLQEIYAPDNACFGCGPSNERGLGIRTFVDGEETVATWQPQRWHQAFPEVLCGGVIGTLLDCHCNWTAAWHLMQRDSLGSPPCTVTAEYTTKLRRPTALSRPVSLRARVVDSEGARVVVEASLFSGGEQTATCRGVFIAVREGHPAYHRW